MEASNIIPHAAKEEESAAVIVVQGSLLRLSGWPCFDAEVNTDGHVWLAAADTTTAQSMALEEKQNPLRNESKNYPNSRAF